MQFFLNLFRCTAGVCDVTDLGNFAREAAEMRDTQFPVDEVRRIRIPCASLKKLHLARGRGKAGFFVFAEFQLFQQWIFLKV